MNIYIIIILCIVLLFITNYLLSYLLMYIEPYSNNISVKDYSYLMKNNNEENLFKVGLSLNTPIYTEDCFEKCDNKSCKILYERDKNLNKCLQCNATKNKCFRKSIIGGNCEDCDETKEDKSDCNNIYNYGCVPPYNLNSVEGVKPYYIQVADNNPASPYNKKCVFCWNILNNI